MDAWSRKVSILRSDSIDKQANGIITFYYVINWDVIFSPLRAFAARVFLDDFFPRESSQINQHYAKWEQFSMLKTIRRSTCISFLYE